jgi:hypothetical protein
MVAAWISTLDFDQHLSGSRCGGGEFDQFEDLGGLADGGDLELTHGVAFRWGVVSPV